MDEKVIFDLKDYVSQISKALTYSIKLNANDGDTYMSWFETKQAMAPHVHQHSGIDYATVGCHMGLEK